MNRLNKFPIALHFIIVILINPNVAVGYTQQNYPFGVLLPQGSKEICDYDNMKLVIEQAMDDAFNLYSIKYYANPVPYDLSSTFGLCDPVRIFPSVNSALGLITPDNALKIMGTTCTGTPPVNDPCTNPTMAGRMIVGPACSAALIAAAYLAMSTTKPTILLTGRAELIYSVRDINLTIRTSYSIYNIWYMFRVMAAKYNWTQFTTITDIHDNKSVPLFSGSGGGIVPGYFDAFSLIIRGGVIYGYDVDPVPMPHEQPGIPNASLSEATCDFDLIPSDKNITDCLDSAKSIGRIIMIFMNPTYVRQILIAAHGRNMTSSEYAYFVTDESHAKYIHPVKPAWKKEDENDTLAKDAFRSLFIIGLGNYENVKEYQDLQGKLTIKSPNMAMNYFYACFYDAMMLFASALRSLFESTSSADQLTAATLSGTGCVKPISTTNTAVDTTDMNTIFNKFISLTNPTPYKGASGELYLDSMGDRLNYWSLYAMTDVDNGIFTEVGRYDALTQNFTEITPGSIPWVGGSPPLSKPDCGYGGTEGPCTPPFPIIAVASGVVIPLFCGLVAIWFYWYKLAKKQAITDREWIVNSRNLNFQRHKKNEFGDDSPENFMQESVAHHDDDKEAGHSMGMSMGISMGQSLGATSMNMTGSMKKRLMMMGEHFGTWNRSAYVLRWANRRVVVLTPQIICEVRVVRKLVHDNVAKFIGACLAMDHVCVLYELCNKGPLNLQFEGDARAKLDWAIRISWIKDIVNAMSYLHTSPIGPHTRLTSHCCFIDARFIIKVTDYGLPTIYTPTLSEFWTSKRNPTNSTAQLWTCPEVLRADAEGTLGTLITKEGDVYSFGIILQEMILRAKPYCMYEQSSIAIVDEVRKGTLTKGLHFRPIFPPDCNGPAGLIDLAYQCWAENPAARPLFDKIKIILRGVTKEMNMGEQTNIMDVFMHQMEETSHQLQITVQKKDEELVKQEMRSDQAYFYIFPREIAEMVMNYNEVDPVCFEHATIMITDIVGFETICSLSSPAEITQLLEEYYDVLEKLYLLFKCFKIDHTADSILVASGISGESGRSGAREIARLALFLLVEIRNFKIHHRANEQLKMRIAIASGPLVLSILQLTAPRYGICGELVQIARRLLRTAECLKIHATASTMHLLESYKVFRFKHSPLSPVPVSDDLDVETYWLVDEEENTELANRRRQLMGGFELLEEEL